MALTDKLSAIGNAIREKTGKSDLLTLEQMTTEIAGIQAGGDDATLAAMVERTLADFVATEKMARIGDYAFQNAASLRSADLTRLGAQSDSLTYIIGANAFDGCTNLEWVVLPEALANATGSTAWLASRAFLKTGLKEFITEYPGELGWSSVQVFKDCPALRIVRIPNIRLVSFDHFSGSSALELVEFGGGNIGTAVFKGCTALRTVIIRSDERIILHDPNAFSGVGGQIKIYVNADLIEGYRTDTNWAGLYTAGTVDFLPIEGSEYE